MDMQTTRKPRKPNLRTMAVIGEEVATIKSKLCELEAQVATLGMKDAIDGLAARVAELEALIKKK